MEIRGNPKGFYGRSRSSNNSSRSASSSRRDGTSSRQTSKLREFVPVHTPDRPTHPLTDIPSDEECYAILSGIQAHNIGRQSQGVGTERRVATWSARGETALHQAESQMLNPVQRRAVSTEHPGGKMSSAAGGMAGIKDTVNSFDCRRYPKTAPSPRSTKDSPLPPSHLESPEREVFMQPEVTAWPGSAAANAFQCMRQQMSPSPPESQRAPNQPEQQAYSFKGPASYRDRPAMLPSPAESISAPPVPPTSAHLSKQTLAVYNRESVYPDALTSICWKSETDSPKSAAAFTGHASATAPKPSTRSQTACSIQGEQICRLCRKPGMMGGGALCLRCESSYLPVASGVFGDNAQVGPDNDLERGRVRMRQGDDDQEEKPFSLDPPPLRRKGLGRVTKASPRGPRAQREDSSREVSPTPIRVGVARGISIKAAMQSPKKIKLVSPGFRPGAHDFGDGGFPAFPRTPGEIVFGKSSPARDASPLSKACLSSPLRAGGVVQPIRLDKAEAEMQEENEVLDDWTVDWEGFEYYLQPPETSENDDGQLDAAFHTQLTDVEERSSVSDGDDEVSALEPSPISPILSKLRGRERTRTPRSKQPAIRFFRSPEPAFF